MPSAAEDTSGDSAAARPPLVGSGADGDAPGSTGTAGGTGRAATVGIFHSARRAGSRLATAAPAPSVNTLSMASVITMARRPLGHTRLATASLLTRCLDSGTGVNHFRGQGATSWNSM